MAACRAGLRMRTGGCRRRQTGRSGAALLLNPLQCPCRSRSGAWGGREPPACRSPAACGPDALALPGLHAGLPAAGASAALDCFSASALPGRMAPPVQLKPRTPPGHLAALRPSWCGAAGRKAYPNKQNIAKTVFDAWFPNPPNAFPWLGNGTCPVCRRIFLSGNTRRKNFLLDKIWTASLVCSQRRKPCGNADGRAFSLSAHSGGRSCRPTNTLSPC